MYESKNNISIEDNKTKRYKHKKNLSTKEEFNLKIEPFVNNTKNFNKNIIFKLKKKDLNYKINYDCIIYTINYSL